MIPKAKMPGERDIRERLFLRKACGPLGEVVGVLGRTPDVRSCMQAVARIVAQNGGPWSAVDVLEVGTGNCLGISSVLGSALRHHQEVREVRLAFAGRRGSTDLHAFVAFVVKALPQEMVHVDPTGQLPSGVVPLSDDGIADAIAKLPRLVAGWPSGLEVKLQLAPPEHRGDVATARRKR